ncbi:MAG: hypothetical protein WCF36_22035 [Candidatus Nanopelagicales bacterium]
MAKLLAPVAAALQRAPVTAAFHETLYNKENATGAYRAAGFSGGTPTTVANPDKASYEISRSASGVTVLIKIRFLQQERNTVPPPNPNPAGLPELGTLKDSATEIPANDPSGRRAWAATTATAATGTWNARRIVFTSQDHPQPGEGAGAAAPPLPPSPVRLPVTFRAQAVFGLSDPAHQQVIVHPPASIPGSPGHPIDAGNWYRQDDDPTKRSKSYPAGDDMIYAHEYGHMLGIPDEYSQSNEQLNALIHKAAPGSAPSARAALDKATIERMALASLARPMYAQLQAALPLMSAALEAKRAAVTRRLSGAARSGAINADVRTELTKILTAESDPKLSASIPRAVSFQTTANFSNLGIADAAVRGTFALGVVRQLIGDAYWSALQAPHATTVPVAGFDDVRINVSSGVYATSAAGTATAGNAASVAGTQVGPTAAGPGLPPIPATSLISQLRGLPATWSAAGSVLETGVTPDAFAAVMAENLKGAAAASSLAAAVAGLIPGHTPSMIKGSGPLYRRAYELVQKSATAAAKQVSADLITKAVQPTLAASVASLQSAIGTETTTLLATPPAGMAAAGPADPQMAAIVSAMKGRLDADKAATAGTGIDPTAPTSAGATPAVPSQDVSYSAQGMMGSNNTTKVRTDQFEKMVAAFNTLLRKKPREDEFKVEVGA